MTGGACEASKRGAARNKAVTSPPPPLTTLAGIDKAVSSSNRFFQFKFTDVLVLNR